MFDVFQGICLFEKGKSKLKWSFLRKSIWILFFELLPDLDDVALDAEGVLKAFSV